jgi:hypothetical protein
MPGARRKDGTATRRAGSVMSEDGTPIGYLRTGEGFPLIMVMGRPLTTRAGPRLAHAGKELEVELAVV